MTLLQIVGDACDEMGLDKPQGIIGNQQPQVRQLFALLRRLCVDLCKQHQWQQLVSTASFQTVSFSRDASMVAGSFIITLADANGITDDFAPQGQGIQKGSVVRSVSGNTIELSLPVTETGTFSVTFGKYRFPMPDGYSRMVDNTLWDTSTHLPMYGSMSSQGWQAFNSAVVSIGVELRYRVRHGKLEVLPTPTGVRSLTYEYVSDQYVISNGVRQSTFTSDQDETVFDNSLLVIGLMLSFRQANGLDASFELGTFQSLLATLKSEDSPMPSINTSRQFRTPFIGQRNVTDGSWNV